jgi:hypothetical protein
MLNVARFRIIEDEATLAMAIQSQIDVSIFDWTGS